MCVLSIKTPGNLFNDPRMFTFSCSWRVKFISKLLMSKVNGKKTIFLFNLHLDNEIFTSTHLSEYP